MNRLTKISMRSVYFLITSISVLVLVLACCLQVIGEGRVLRFSRSNSGLVDNHVNQLLDQGESVAIATPNGVTLLSRDHMESWRRGDRGFPDASARALAIFGGRLWVGTHGHGLARLEGDRWRAFSQADIGLPDAFIEALAAFGNKLYIGTREGLCSYDGLLCENIPMPGPAPLSIRCLAADGSQLLIGTNMGLFKITAANSNVVTPIVLGFSSEPTIDAIALDGGNIYAAGEFGLVAIMTPDGRKQMWARERFSTTRFYALWPIPGSGNILCGTARGIFLARKEGTVEQVSLAEIPGTVPVTAMIRSGSFFWIGTGGVGVLRLLAEPGTTSLSGPADVNRDTGLAISADNGIGRGVSIVDKTPAKGLPLQDIVIFPPPENVSRNKVMLGAASNTTSNKIPSDDSSIEKKVTAVASETSSRVRPYWTRFKKQRMTDLSFYKDILPVIVKECMGCHTTGPGKYFPLNDPVTLLAYFRKDKLTRFMSFCDEGGGMFGKVDPKTIHMLQMWVMFGCKE